MSARQSFFRYLQVAFDVVLVAGIMASVVLLAATWLDHRRQDSSALATIKAQAQALVGRSVPNAVGVTRAHDTVSFVPRSGLRVLYVFSPKCAICSRVKPDVATIAARLGARFVSATLDPSDTSVYSYWRGTQSSETVVMALTKETRTALAVSATPTFLVLDSLGTITEAQVGFRSREETDATLSRVGR